MNDWNENNQERKENLPDLRLSAKYAAWDLKKIKEEAKRMADTLEEIARIFRKHAEKGGQL